MKQQVSKMLFEQIKISYRSFQVNNTPQCTSIDNFIVSGIDLRIYGERIDLEFDKFDIIDYANLESYLKPRLTANGRHFFFNKRRIVFYVTGDFPETAKGDFDYAMYIFNALDLVKKEIEKLLNSIGKLPYEIK